MPEKKLQHYVPKFYLKNFSILKSGKQINLYNIPDKKYIEKDRFNNQAAIDYFYGKDLVIENGLQAIETYSSPFFKNICNSNILKHTREELWALLLFIVTLEKRTPYAAEEENEMLDK